MWEIDDVTSTRLTKLNMCDTVRDARKYVFNKDWVARSRKNVVAQFHVRQRTSPNMKDIMPSAVSSGKHNIYRIVKRLPDEVDCHISFTVLPLRFFRRNEMKCTVCTR